MTILFCGLAFYFSEKIEKLLISIISSIIGAYLGVRSISMLAGGFPDEKLLDDFIAYREPDQQMNLFSPTFYLYMFAGLLILIGIYYQLNICVVEPEDTKEENKDNENNDKNKDKQQESQAKTEAHNNETEIKVNLLENDNNNNNETELKGN